MRRTKIVTTLGPATDDPKVLTEMVHAGADVVRVNFSHGRFEEHAKRVQLVRDAALACGKYVGVLGDLRGPKIRIERFAEGRIFLKEGDAFSLDVSLDPNAGTARAVGCAYKTLPQAVYPTIFHMLLELRLVDEGDLIIVTKGELSGVSGGTNSMQILQVTRS